MAGEGSGDKASSSKKNEADDWIGKPSGQRGDKQADINSLLERLAMSGQGKGKSEEMTPDMSKHRFWATQPVTHYNEKAPDAEGPIQPEDISKVRKEPYPLLEGFEWVTMDLEDPAELQELYTLLYENYVEDQEAMFRFNYSKQFLNWALKAPGWRKDWHVGIRATKSRRLVAFISGIPVALRVRGARVSQCSEVNFLCIHKKLRDKRLAPVLIREITRRCNVVGVWQAIYTGGILLPTPVGTCRYYHRSLDWAKLNEVGFSPLPSGSTKALQIRRNALPTATKTPRLRETQAKDVDGVLDLLGRYLNRMDMAQEFSREEVQHWLLNAEKAEQDQVVYSYVVDDEQGKVTDFFSFYCIESTVIGHPKVKSIKVAYLFYYATEAAFDSTNGTGMVVLKKRLNELMNDALILAKKLDFDVFNALTMLDNPLFLSDQKFGPGDGKLHYYLYNYRTAPLQGGLSEPNQMADPSAMGGIGVVML